MSPAEFVIASLLKEPNVAESFKHRLAAPAEFLVHVDRKHDQKRRFADLPEAHSAFGDLDGIYAKGSDRYLEVRDQEHADDLRGRQLDRDAA